MSWETYVINLILLIKNPRLREGKANCPRSRGQYVTRLTPHHRPVKRRGVGGPRFEVGDVGTPGAVERAEALGSYGP